MLEAAAWKNLVNEKHYYLLQFESGSSKDVDMIQKTLKDWQQTGFGFTNKGTEKLIFRKLFENTDQWLLWVKDSPFIVNEIDKEGKPNRLKTAAVTNEKTKRICSKCLQSGHNSATCGKVKPPGKNKCKVCGMLGHNRATCAVFKRQNKSQQ